MSARHTDRRRKKESTTVETRIFCVDSKSQQRLPANVLAVLCVCRSVGNELPPPTVETRTCSAYHRRLGYADRRRPDPLASCYGMKSGLIATVWSGS
jgi:hypothetical protein